MPQHDTGFRDVADHPQSVEQIARRVAQLLQRDAEARGFQLLDTGTVARIMAVSEDWVRAHAAELGAIRVGDGAKGTFALRAYACPRSPFEAPGGVITPEPTGPCSGRAPPKLRT